MPANQTNVEFGFLAGRYPGALGHLYSPGAHTGPHHFFPYALDNGAYSAWSKNLDFDVDAWRRHLDWGSRQRQRPLWAVVPDFVASHDLTLERWHMYVGEVRSRGMRPAFAVQNGATFDAAPDDECMLFIGGTDEFKDPAIAPWCARFPGRVHVGRVNRKKRLWACYEAGAVSVDGTGWYHVNNGQRAELVDFIQRTHGKDRPRADYLAAV